METMLLKFGLSALFGIIIGLDRELKKKPLGLKTCLVLSVSSCLLTIVSIESAFHFPMTNNMRVDPLRLAAQIVSGVGFIGAGVILKRSNEVIVGLTTAAMIWGASGIGIAVGAGYYIEAAIALLIILIGVDLLPYLLKLFGPKSLMLREMDVVVTLKKPDSSGTHSSERDMDVVPIESGVERQSRQARPGDRHVSTDDDLAQAISQLQALRFHVHTTRITSLERGLYQLQLRIEADDHVDALQVFREIERVAGVEQIDVRSY